MKKQIITLIFIFSLVLSESCITKCDCDPFPVGDLSELQLMKDIVEINAVNFSTGFESYFTHGKSVFDSTQMAHIFQSVINPVRFLEDETGYFFVESNNAWMIAHATKPELIGTYRYNVEDINGKFYVRDMVEAINYKGYGFVDYYFQHPQTKVPARKISFVKAIHSAGAFIGTGFYNYEEYRYYDYEEASLIMVENATRAMAMGIGGGIDIMNDSTEGVMFCREFIDKIRFFDNQSGYFFIYDFDCVNVAHGTQKDLQGENLYNYQDSKGNYVIRDLVYIAQNSGSGYYEYYWNNPVNGKEEAKKAFVYKIPGINYLIGSGVYTK